MSSSSLKHLEIGYILGALSSVSTGVCKVSSTVNTEEKDWFRILALS